MAEFVEVMRQAHRMCRECGCADCPMLDVDALNKCNLIFGKEYTPEDLLNIEQRIVQWAKENPEPQYPTWKEWVATCFPTAKETLCPQSFMSEDEWARHVNGRKCGQLSCDECINTPIPADIAKKLGINPIHSSENKEE